MGRTSCHAGDAWGADLPYCKHLNGHGNALIKRFVQSGGAYLGLCAGAYYAAARVEFEPGKPLEVVGDRELAFFPGTARGAAYPGFDYQTEAGAVAADVQFAVPPELAGQLQLQQQVDKPQQQMPSSKLTDSWGHHDCSWWHTHDYCNGGPYFVTLQGELDLAGLPGVEVLARYAALPHRDAQQQQQQCIHQTHSSIAMQPGQQPHQQQQHNAQHDDMRNVQHASVQQPSAWQAAAALRCTVGLGVAVLCGTHPELEPQWLDVCGRTLETATAAQETSSGDVSHRAAVGSGTQGMAVKDSSWHACAAAGLAGAMAISGTQMVEQGAVVDTINVVKNSSWLNSKSSKFCSDAQLALHTQALHSTLAASQHQRDLFLSCLLYKALYRP